MIAHLAATLAVAAPPEELAVRAELAHFVEADRVDAVVAHLEAVAETTAAALARIGSAPPAEVRAALYRRVAENLARRHPPGSAPGLPITEADLVRTVLDYEGFRLARYVSAGVAPRSGTSAGSTSGTTRGPRSAPDGDVVACAVDVINADRAAAGDPLRISEAEVAVTFFAEGGALLVERRRHDGILPVGGIGNHYIGYGVQSYRDVASAVDVACGTDVLGTLVWSAAGTRPTEQVVRRNQRSSDPVRTAWLTRTWTLEEAVAGTALMWLWERELTAGMLRAAGREGSHPGRPTADRDHLDGLQLGRAAGRAHPAGDGDLLATGERLAEQARRRTSGRLAIDLVPPRSLVGGGGGGCAGSACSRPAGCRSTTSCSGTEPGSRCTGSPTCSTREDRWVEPGIPRTCPVR